jgi:hypothetical protein
MQQRFEPANVLSACEDVTPMLCRFIFQVADTCASRDAVNFEMLPYLKKHLDCR